jgi:hypothetical protein
MTTSSVRVLVTVDVEEDQWASYAETGASTHNLEKLPELRDLAARHGARPTLFVNRPPLVEPRSAAIIRRLVEDGGCEIGTHCHPWNTPPFTGPEGFAGSMMFNLPGSLNRAKIAEVHRLIEAELGVVPTSFRAGRWGLGPTVAGALVELGYTVDSSVTPFLDWSGHGGPNYARAPLRPYRFHPADVLRPSSDGPLVEVPATVGFLHGVPEVAARIRTALARGYLRRTRLLGLLDRLGLVACRWLSPETSTGEEMVALARNLVAREVGILNLTLHSSTLVPGLTPFVRDERDRTEFLRRIDTFLSFCAQQGFAFATIAEVGRLDAARGAPGAVA